MNSTIKDYLGIVGVPRSALITVMNTAVIPILLCLNSIHGLVSVPPMIVT